MDGDLGYRRAQGNRDSCEAGAAAVSWARGRPAPGALERGSFGPLPRPTPAGSRAASRRPWAGAGGGARRREAGHGVKGRGSGGRTSLRAPADGRRPVGVQLVRSEFRRELRWVRRYCGGVGPDRASRGRLLVSRVTRVRLAPGRRRYRLVPGPVGPRGCLVGAPRAARPGAGPRECGTPQRCPAGRPLAPPGAAGPARSGVSAGRSCSSQEPGAVLAQAPEWTAGAGAPRAAGAVPRGAAGRGRVPEP